MIGEHKFFVIPSFTLPKIVSFIGGKLPQWPHTIALTATLNSAIQCGLLPRENLVPLENRRFLIDILDTGTYAVFYFLNGRFRPLFSVPNTPDLIFRANLSVFLQIVTRQEDPDTLFFNRTLIVEGDTELGLIVKNMLDAVEWQKYIPGFGVSEPIYTRR